MVELEESYIVSKAHFIHKAGPCGPSKRTGLVRGVLYIVYMWWEQQFLWETSTMGSFNSTEIAMVRGLLLDRQLSYWMPKRVTYLNLLYELYVAEKLFQLCLHCNLLLLPGACVSKGFCVLQTSSVRTEKCKQVRTPAHGDNSLVAASEHESNLQLKHSV